MPALYATQVYEHVDEEVRTLREELKQKEVPYTLGAYSGTMFRS